MKKISVAFNGLNFSDGTLKYAIELAVSAKALLSGVFLDDFFYHKQPALEMLDNLGIQGVDLVQLQQQDDHIRKESIKNFDSACREKGINYVIHHDKSFALDDLIKESIYSDLLVIGAGETFNHYEEVMPSAFIRNLLASVHCPVMVVPAKYQQPENIVLLYDGKLPSVFAIKMFDCVMPWIKEATTEVLSVRGIKDQLELHEDLLVREFITCHYPRAKYTVLRGDPEEQIPAYIKKLVPQSIIVAGAYQRSTVSRWLKTSMADILINELTMPVFIAHQK